MTTINHAELRRKGQTHLVEDMGNGYFQVTSGSSHSEYIVVLDPTGTTARCSCKWGQRAGDQPLGKGSCSHVKSAVAFMDAAAEMGIQAFAACA